MVMFSFEVSSAQQVEEIDGDYVRYCFLVKCMIHALSRDNDVMESIVG